jgi:hypothetical protein
MKLLVHMREKIKSAKLSGIIATRISLSPRSPAEKSLTEFEIFKLEAIIKIGIQV